MRHILLGRLCDFVLAVSIAIVPFAVQFGQQKKIKPPTQNKHYDRNEFKNDKGDTLIYYLMKPANYDPNKKYPLVLALHGRGGNTTAANVLGSDKMRKKYLCFVMAPMAPKPSNWAAPKNLKPGKNKQQKLPLVFGAIEKLKKEVSIDPARIYVTGQSMGGFGSFGAIVARPELFAAAAPICGGWTFDDAAKIAHIPIWVFHGSADKTVPTKYSRDMVAAIKNAGGKPKYTEYEGVGHNSWTQTYSNPEFWVWLFDQEQRSKV